MVTAIHLPPSKPATSVLSTSSPASAAISPSPPWRWPQEEARPSASRSAAVARRPCASTPPRRRLSGRLEDPRAVAEAAALLVEASDPVDDVRGSADYRRRLIPRLLAAALADLRESREAA